MAGISFRTVAFLVFAICAVFAAPPFQGSDRFNLVLIGGSITVLYIASWLASKNKIISVVLHRKIWNLLLLIAFLGNTLLALTLVAILSYGIENPLPVDPLFWHAEFGIALVFIALFHILWHISYFQAYIQSYLGRKAPPKQPQSPAPGDVKAGKSA